MKFSCILLTATLLLGGCAGYERQTEGQPEPSPTLTIVRFTPEEQKAIMAVAAISNNPAAQAMADAKYRPLLRKDLVLASGDQTGQVERTILLCPPTITDDDCDRGPTTLDQPKIYIHYTGSGSTIQFEQPRMYVAYTSKWYINCDEGPQLNKSSFKQLKQAFNQFAAKGQGYHTLSIDFAGNKEFAAQKDVSWSCYVNPNDAPQTQISP